jgi:hypothetical protein
MKRKPEALGVALLALVALMTPASAGVSKAQRAACEKAAIYVRPALRADEKEAWIANCLADAAYSNEGRKNKSGY